MAYIKDIQIGSDTYLIEPTLYIAPSKNGAAYTASLANFSLVTGATVQVKFAATNDANATLNINSTGAKEIHYNGAKITANQFKANHVYTLVYDGTQWQVSGDIDTNTQAAYGNITTGGLLGTASQAVVTDANKKITTADLSTADPTAATTTSTTFIDSISQNAQGKITATKKTLPAASTSTAGIIKIGTTANDAAAGNHTHNASDINDGILNTARLPSDVVKIYNRNQIGIAPNFDNPGINGYFEIRNSSETTQESGLKPFNGFGNFLNLQTSVSRMQIAGTQDQWYIRGTQSGQIDTAMSTTQWNRIVLNSGSWDISITGNATSAETLVNKTLTTTTINNTAGSYAFSIAATTNMSQITTSSTDYVGLQIGDSKDKWQLTATGNCLYFRQNDNGGTNTSWKNWVQILDNSTTTAGTNNADTLAWNTTYTIAKINGTDIKFTTMAKPSYAFTDLTAHPTTLSGYGITDAASSGHSHTLKIGNKSLSVSTSEQEWTVHDILYTDNIYQSTSWNITTPGIYGVTNGSHNGDGHPGSTSGQTTPYAYGHLIITRAGNYGAAQIYISHVASGPKAANKGIRYRSGWNVVNNTETGWQAWATILDDKNFNLYAPTLTGTGASGTWDISITGNAATASSVTWDHISSKPDEATRWPTFSEVTDKPTTISGYGITDAYIRNNTVFLGNDSITFSIDNLGLEGVLHFIGMVRPNSQYQPSDGTNGAPTIVGRATAYTPANGDVVLDKDGSREYVYANDVWVQLGFSASAIYDSNAVTSTEEEVPTWISRVQQSTDGTVTVEKATLGILPVAHGGTGVSSFNANEVIISANPSGSQAMTLISRPYSDSSSAEALTNSTNFVTERDVYYGLPTINGNHTYTSETSIYAPSSAGGLGQILTSSEGIPVWAKYIIAESAFSDTAATAAYSTLTLGNNVNQSANTEHSEGQIQLYSAATHAHILQGASTTADYTHILPNSNGYLVQTPSAAAVGSNTNPIYIAANGIVTALTYTAHRLYFSATANSFEATNHYADADHIGLGATAWPTNCEDTLYVTGTSTFNNNIRLLNHIYFGQPASNDDPQYYIDSSAVGFLSDLRVDNIQLDNNYIKFYQNINAGTSLYGSVQGTATRLIFNWATTDPLPAFEFNGDLLPSASNDPQVVYSLGADNSRWHHLFLKGDIYMQNLGTPEELATSNKIMWQSSYNNAEIYFVADPTAGAGKLVLNSSANTDSTIAIAFAGEDTAYINYSEPSFYPAITNGGSLGTADNTWAKLYIGANPSYGDAYTPIYWNNGAPAVVAPLQYQTFTITSGSHGVQLAHAAFTADSYVTQIVVTSGEANLNSPIAWASSTGTIQLTCSTVPSGAVSGYIILGRGTALNATSSVIA